MRIARTIIEVLLKTNKNSMFLQIKRKMFLGGAFVLIIWGLAVVAGASHSWGGYHWARTANPFTLNLGDNVSSAWDAYLGTASGDWSLSSVLDTLIVPGGTNEIKGKKTPKNCVPTSGRVEVCTAKYGANGWLGLATVWVSGDHITQATAKMNDTYFNTSKYNTPAWRRFVMCQEIAHGFGLAHQDETFNNLNMGTCMDYTNDPDGTIYSQLSNEHPNQHDYDMLETIYNGHFDATATLKSEILPQGNSSFDVDLSDPAAWGKEVRRSKDGSSSLFERDLGGGHKVFTFVFWAR